MRITSCKFTYWCYNTGPIFEEQFEVPSYNTIFVSFIVVGGGGGGNSKFCSLPFAF